MGTIWQRYVLGSLLKGFLFFLFCFFFLYSLIDFSTHSQDFFIKGSLNFSKLSSFYSYQFIKRLELLLPLSLLISTARTLTTLNASRELVALQASGLSLKKIFRPFFQLAVVCSLLGYCNEEVFIPKWTASFTETKHARTKNPLKKTSRKQFTVLCLNDSSKLIYQSFDPEKNVFFDVYWITSFNDIWRMKYLNADPKEPIGQFVDHIVRNKEGLLEKKESFDITHIPSLKWDFQQLNKKQSSIKYQKISQLAKLMWESKDNRSFHLRSEIQTYFFRKLAIPLLPFLILIGVLPFCVRYSRIPPVFMIYGPSLLAFVVFFTLMNAMTIIGENRVIPPFIAVFSPLILSLTLTAKRFYKIL